MPEQSNPGASFHLPHFRFHWLTDQTPIALYVMPMDDAIFICTAS